MIATKDPSGHVMTRARIVLVFIGDGWQSGLPSQADTETCFRDVLATPYLSYLAQYDGIRRPEIVSVVTGPSSIGSLASDPRKYIPQVQLIAEQDIVDVFVADVEKTPRPPDEQTLYMAVVSCQTSPLVKEHQDAGGRHLEFSHSGITYRYGWVLNWAGNTEDNIWRSSGSLPGTFAHEVIEACSDPDGSRGYRIDPPQDPNSTGENELSDQPSPGHYFTRRLPGMTYDVTLEGYWSNLHNDWVAPTGYSVRAALGQQTPQRVTSIRSIFNSRSVRGAVLARCT